MITMKLTLIPTTDVDITSLSSHRPRYQAASIPSARPKRLPKILTEEENLLGDVNLSLTGDENEEEVKTFWKGLIKQMDGGVK